MSTFDRLDAREPCHDRRVIAEAAVAVQLAEIAAHRQDVIACLGA
jgi:hypothetical protein